MRPLACVPRRLATCVALLFLLSPLVVAQRKDSPLRNRAGVAQLSMEQQDALDMLKTLAQSLKSESDKLTAATQQARIADVLWVFDEPFAKETFRWAFDAASKPPSDDMAQAERARYIVRQAASIKQILTCLRTHDQKRAEAWLKTLEEEKEREGRTSEARQFHSELLIQVALQLAATDPEQAQRLGALSLLGPQIPEDFGRLLFALSNVSRSESDKLFRAALATLRRNEYAYDGVLIALINYLFSPGGTLQSDASAADAQLLANYFVDAAWRQGRGAGVSVLPDSSANFYSLIEARGWPIVTRYAAERVPELQGQMREMASRLSPSHLENTARLRTTQQQQIAVTERSGADIDEQIKVAAKHQDVQVRDSLLNSIAHSLMRVDNDKALKVASMIDDPDIRARAEDDINLVKIQQLIASKSYEEARKTTLKLKNTLVQAKVLVELAGKVLTENKDTGRATELLSEASEITSRSAMAANKLMAFLVIAQQFAKFDAIRGFETLGSAIKVVNHLKNEAPKSVLTKPRLLTIKTYTVINGNEMSTSDHATLESIDFSQVAPFVATDYMQTRLLGSKIENSLHRARFLTAVASALLLQSQPQSASTLRSSP